tara:strand:- start:285 stop:965 length:681 start_codon:yes stop_codon:yes gene_type:complete
MKKNILCIVAHPDDEALGVGGSLIKHAEAGDTVNVIIFSDGEGAKEQNDKNPDRLYAAKMWSEKANCNLYKKFNYPDQRLDTIPQIELVNKIEKILIETKPNIVYIHNPMDINKDHQVISEACLVALRPMKFPNSLPEIRAFETPSSTEQAPNLPGIIFKPNLYISVFDVWQKKIKALEAYEKEIGKFPHPRSVESLKALAIKRGAESGLKYAEAFIIIKKIIAEV